MTVTADQLSNEAQKLITELTKEKNLGDDVKSFLNTSIGKYLLERALADRYEALSQLEITNASDTPTIIELQQRAKMCRSLLEWFNSAISNANIASDTIRSELSSYARDSNY